jgi:hypothetical protein
VKRVLLIGGVADGRWVEAGDHDTRVLMPKPTDIGAYFGDPSSVMDPFEFEEAYRILRIPVSTWRVWVGIAGSVKQDEDRLIVRALFQRDVAKEILEESWH